MMQFPHIDPVAFHLGSWPVRWYGLMYLFGFVAAWLLGRSRVARPGKTGLVTRQQFDDLLLWGLVGVIVGARLGYVVFYNFSSYLENPVDIFAIWAGGMSFHGGLIGVIVAQWLAGHSRGLRFFDIFDFIAPLVPPGLFFGRIGNFINGELWGRPSDVPWAMVFTGGGPLARHPSQLYEAALEGVLLFFVLWWFSSKPRPRMAVSGLFLLGYGLCRFTVEFFREPDVQLGFIFGDFLTMGMLLCLPMILSGALLLGYAYHKRVA